MQRSCVTTAIIACFVGVADHASAVNLNPNGMGQVLLYPYYTVNAGQQTLVTVINTTNVGKVVKVRFLEGYNGREVLDFNLYLSHDDVWTGNIFSLADAGLSGDGAGIFTTDTSCTDPALISSGTIHTAAGPHGYQQFRNANYTGSAVDTGPTDDARTREGHLEMILMSDVISGSPLDLEITHAPPIGVPPDCAVAVLENAQGYAPPTSSPATDSNSTIADGGLFGSASVVDVEEGTFYAYNADAIDGFSYLSLYTPPGDPKPTLESVNDRGNPLTATSRVFVNGESLTSTFPSATPGSRTIDAISSLFAADGVYNEYVTAQDGSIGSDWVVTFPTKRFYVDAQPGGAVAGAARVFAPLEKLFGASDPGQSCITIDSSTDVFNREGGVLPFARNCGVLCPPGGPPTPLFCLETNVLRFATTSVLGSKLPGPTFPSLGQGFAKLNLNLTFNGIAHDLSAASNGNVFHGLPVTGFAVAKFVNNFVPLPGGSTALANYTSAYHHRTTTSCSHATGRCS